jgi:hypothetical protein
MIANVVEALKAANVVGSSESRVGHESRVGQREGDDQLLLPIIVSDPALQMPAGLCTIYCTSTYDR